MQSLPLKEDPEKLALSQRPHQLDQRAQQLSPTDWTTHAGPVLFDGRVKPARGRVARAKRPKLEARSSAGAVFILDKGEKRAGLGQIERDERRRKEAKCRYTQHELLVSRRAKLAPSWR
jgi:hypothetical protein